MQQFIQEYSKCPNIYGEVVFLLKYHLRSHVLIRATKGLPLHFNIISCPSKIADFNIEGIIEEYVLWLSRLDFTLMSLCMMSLECMYLMAERVWLKNLYASA